MASRERLWALDGAGEMAPRKLIAHEGAHGLEPRRPRAGQIVEHLPVAGDDLRNRLVRHVEDGVVAMNPGVPQARHVLASLERTRMQQAIPARRVGRYGERVASGIG